MAAASVKWSISYAMNKVMFTLYRMVFCVSKESCPRSWKATARDWSKSFTYIEHRPWWSGWTREFGELKSSPYFWTFTSASVNSSLRSYFREFWRPRRRRQRERQKSNRFIEQNNNSAHASHFFVHFFAVKCLLSRFMEDVNKRWRVLECGSQEIKSREICLK